MDKTHFLKCSRVFIYTKLLSLPHCFHLLFKVIFVSEDCQQAKENEVITDADQPIIRRQAEPSELFADPRYLLLSVSLYIRGCI